MKKFLLSASLITVFILYTVSNQQLFSLINSVLIEDDDDDDISEQRVIGPAVPAKTFPTTSQPPIMMRPGGMMSVYKDGTFTGNVADAYYGMVQVKAVISGGVIADVQFLQYPSDRKTSININNQAMPMLKAEAIQIQNANVDTISGATHTSGAFRESLAYALNQAKK